MSERLFKISVAVVALPVCTVLWALYATMFLGLIIATIIKSSLE